MPVAIITGSAGLVGSEASRHFARTGHTVLGIDNDMRQVFFGKEASTRWNRELLERELGASYRHQDLDIRDREAVEKLFAAHGADIALVVHAAAQPSHDWAMTDPHTDFTVNANGTLVLLEATRRFCPQAVFIYCSTNKVYGDAPNALPLVETGTRFEIDPSHRFVAGIDESMTIDQSKHSLFGASKAAADLMVQEYGRYFGMKTACFRGGCLTGPAHSGTALHGFLAYLMHCTLTGRPYRINGYKGKQVRDNIHSVDLISAFDAFYRAPRSGEVYNMGGGRHSNCSMLEAIQACERIAGRKLESSYSPEARVGDHVWYISDVGKFQAHYPGWRYRYDMDAILEDICRAQTSRTADATAS